MRNHHDSALVRLQRVQNLLTRGGVQVVGRLIEQQHIRARRHQGRQGQTGLLTAGKHTGRLIHIIAGEQERTQNRAHAGVIQIRRGRLHVLKDSAVAIKNFVFLRKIAQLRAVTVHNLTRIRLGGTSQHAQQSGLTGTVQAQHHHARTAVNRQINVRENLQRAIGLRQALGRERSLTARRRIREANRRNLIALTLILQAAQKLFSTLNHLLSGNSLRRLRTHLIRLLHQSVRLLLRIRTLTLAAVLILLTLSQVVLPAHVVLVNHAAVRIQVEDAVDDQLHQVNIVANDHQAAREVLQEIAQPQNRIGVQVVGRLVQKHGVRIGEENTRQLHAATLTTRQSRQWLGEHTLRQVQVGGDDRRLRLSRVAAASNELSLKTVVAAHTLSAHRRVLTRHIVLRLTHLARHTVQATRRKDAVTRQLAHVIHLRVLRKVADSAAAGHRTVSGQGQTGKHLSHGGLTGTVAAHQTNLVALIDAEGDLFHEQARACTQFEVLYSNHGCLSGWRSGVWGDSAR